MNERYELVLIFFLNLKMRMYYMYIITMHTRQKRQQKPARLEGVNGVALGDIEVAPREGDGVRELDVPQAVGAVARRPIGDGQDNLGYEQRGDQNEVPYANDVNDGKTRESSATGPELHQNDTHCLSQNECHESPFNDGELQIENNSLRRSVPASIRGIQAIAKIEDGDEASITFQHRNSSTGKVNSSKTDRVGGVDVYFHNQDTEASSHIQRRCNTADDILKHSDIANEQGQQLLKGEDVVVVKSGYSIASTCSSCVHVHAGAQSNVEKPQTTSVNFQFNENKSTAVSNRDIFSSDQKCEEASPGWGIVISNEFIRESDGENENIQTVEIYANKHDEKGTLQFHTPIEQDIYSSTNSNRRNDSIIEEEDIYSPSALNRSTSSRRLGRKFSDIDIYSASPSSTAEKTKKAKRNILDHSGTPDPRVQIDNEIDIYSPMKSNDINREHTDVTITDKDKLRTKPEENHESLDIYSSLKTIKPHKEEPENAYHKYSPSALNSAFTGPYDIDLDSEPDIYSASSKVGETSKLDDEIPKSSDTSCTRDLDIYSSMKLNDVNQTNTGVIMTTMAKDDIDIDIGVEPVSLDIYSSLKAVRPPCVQGTDNVSIDHEDDLDIYSSSKSNQIRLTEESANHNQRDVIKNDDKRGIHSSC